MANIRLITDAPSDIPDEILKELDNIVMLTYPIFVDGREYRERGDFTVAGFYDVLAAAKEIPTTAHANMVEYGEAFEKALLDGIDHLFVCVISSAGSNSYHTAMMAKNTFMEKNPNASMTLDIIDSHSYSLGYAFGIIAAARAAKAGNPTRDEILAILEDFLRSHRLVLTLFNLDYARKSGRISTAAAFVGEMLGFRPILFVNENGVIENADRVRGDNKAIAALADEYFAKCTDLNAPYYIARGADTANALELEALIKAKTGKASACIYQVGASVAINAGPTVLGLLYRNK